MKSLLVQFLVQLAQVVAATFYLLVIVPIAFFSAVVMFAGAVIYAAYKFWFMIFRLLRGPGKEK